MKKILEKYHSLSPKQQKEVDDFINLLLQKSTKPFDIEKWKKDIDSVSEWSDEDVKIFEDNRKLFKNWQSEKW